MSCIEEAVRDKAVAFAMAAVFEFENSNTDELLKCKQANGSHNAILLECFKKWINSSCEDVSFKYYSQMITLFGTLQQMYINAVKYRNGVAWEASRMIMHDSHGLISETTTWMQWPI